MSAPPPDSPRPVAGIRPHRIFPLIALPLGLLFLILTPPLQAPDEIFHLYRAFQVSRGGWICGRPDNASPPGVVAPVSFGLLANDPYVSKVGGQPDLHVTRPQLLALWQIPLKAGEREFVPLLNTSLYPPTVYIPQAIGIGLASLLHPPAVALIYAGRLCNLLFWTALIVLTLHILPFFRWVFFLIALMPLLVFQTATLSTDATVVGLSFLLIALFLRSAWGPEARVPWRFLAGILIGCPLLAAAKQVYAPFVLLFLLIPVERIGSRRRYWSLFATLLCLTGLAFVLWSRVVDRNFVPMYEGIDPARQKAYILAHPLLFAAATLRAYYYIDSVAMWVGRLGWYDTSLPDMIVWGHLFLLAYSVSLDRLDGVRFARRERAIVVGVLFLTILVLTAGVYVVWAPVGLPIVRGLRPGRYFVPMLPLLALAFFRARFRKNWVLVGVPAFLGLWTLLVVVRRYYG